MDGKLPVSKRGGQFLIKDLCKNNFPFSKFASS